MKKNVASQVIGAQMVSATDGSAFSGTVTVYVTGNGGTQAIGSVGSGVCTHEGNGYHTYAPAQAETNYDHVAFTFIGSGAIPSTVQVYPNFPQTGDAFARLGAPAGASVSADVAAVNVLVLDLPTNAELATALGDVPTATENADALLTRDMSAVTEGSGRTPLQAFRILRNRWVISGTTQSVKKEDDTTDSWTQELGTTPGADPVTSTNPA